MAWCVPSVWVYDIYVYVKLFISIFEYNMNQPLLYKSDLMVINVATVYLIETVHKNVLSHVFPFWLVHFWTICNSMLNRTICLIGTIGVIEYTFASRWQVPEVDNISNLQITAYLSI